MVEISRLPVSCMAARLDSACHQVGSPNTLEKKLHVRETLTKWKNGKIGLKKNTPVLPLKTLIDTLLKEND
jgi:hypothetical protein